MIALVVAILVVVIGLVIIQETRDTDAVRKSLSGTKGNETLTTVTETGEVMTTGNSAPGHICTVDVVTNATGGQVINAGNYTTLTDDGCTIKSTGSTYNNTNWNVSYTYTFGDSSWTAANKSIGGFDDFADFVPLIVLAMVAAIIVGIILTSFAMKKQR